MTENPYDPPCDTDPAAAEQEEDSEQAEDSDTGPADDPFPYYVPIVQFSLRLLGVYIAVSGVATLVEDVFNIINVIETYGPGLSSFSQFHARFIGSCLYFGVGVYLIFGGRWFIEKVFLPVDRRR